MAGLALGAARSASGQTPDSQAPAAEAALERSQGAGEGADRLRRALPFRDVGTRPGRRTDVSRHVRADVPRADAASGLGRHHHAVLALLRGDPPRLLRPGDRSQRASADDPRHGGPAADLHDGRVEAPPVRLPRSLHRVPRKPCAGQAQDRPGNARVDQLRRMDRRAAVAVAQGGRRAERRVLDRGGRGRGSEGLLEHSAREGDGRLPGVPTARMASRCVLSRASRCG